MSCDWACKKVQVWSRKLTYAKGTAILLEIIMVHKEMYRLTNDKGRLQKVHKKCRRLIPPTFELGIYGRFFKTPY